MAASIRRSYVPGIATDTCRAVEVKLIEDLEPEQLRIRLEQAQADLAILIIPPVSDHHDQSALELVKVASAECPVVVIVPEHSPERCLALLHAGASDFVVCPARPADLLPRVARLLQLRAPEAPPTGPLKPITGASQILGTSPKMLTQLDKLPRVAGCDANVLISGETGTGKELFARAIHYLSRRAHGPFVAVNCGAIPSELIENELFGHEAGAYTTANTAQAGLLREALEGSLFLDEIDALSLPLQVKLLRFLQDKEYRPLGSSKPRRADVRMIAAANVSLEEAMRNGRFRQDLYYRLSVLSIDLPPLRERQEDVPLLARHFIGRYVAEFKRPARELTPEALRLLRTHPWPGNVRELENVIQRAVLLSETAVIDAPQLGLPAQPAASGDTSFKYLKAKAVHDFERRYLADLLAEHAGNISAAARAAGKNRRAFWELLRKHELLSAQSTGAAGRYPRPAPPIAKVSRREIPTTQE